jgi:hypothetical protein
MTPFKTYIMKNDKSPLTALLSLAAIAGNVLFALWILYNGINVGFQGTTIEKFSYAALMVLLAVNAFLLIRNYRQQNRNN